VAGYWLNGQWNALPSIDDNMNSIVEDPVVDGSDVYAAGTSQNSSGHDISGYWLNRNWHPLTDETMASHASSITISR
jgi:hypothetical protein